MVKRNNNTRQHSTPGLYFSDNVVEYAKKSLGITALGLVGETLKGRAFEATPITDWGDFVNNFGGTSTEQYRGSKYPKYELPYIAQSYLEQSHNLNVVRVLGLSGVNAGPAWVVTAHGATEDNEYNNMVVLVIRSRGEHKKASFVKAADPANGICDDVYEYDGIQYYAKSIELIPSKTLNLGQDCNPGYSADVTGHGDGYFTSDALNYGTFTIKVLINDSKSEEPNEEDRNYKYYSVTLNPSDKNYIYNVIGGDPEKGDAEIYVEELYDVALKQLVKYGDINGINQTVVTYQNVNIVPAYEDVYDLLTEPVPTRKEFGRRYLYSTSESVIKNEDSTEPITVFYSTDDGKTWWEGPGINGMIYTVNSYVNPETGKRVYFYGSYVENLNASYVEITDATEKQNIAKSVRCVTKCESTITSPQNSFGTVPTGTSNVTNSPMYVMQGRGNAKVLSAYDGGVLYADGLNNGSLTLCDFQQVTTAHEDDVIVFEVGSPSDKLDNIVFKVKYGNQYLTPNNNVDSQDAQAFNITNASGFWRLFVHLGGQDRDFDYTGTEPYGVNSDPSKISVEYVSAKYYKKTINTSESEGFVNGVKLENKTNFKTEMLTTFDYTTDVDDMNKFTNCVYVVSDKSFFVNSGQDVKPVTLDFNNYKEQYRWASSPWIVSEMKGSAENVELNKLFRFHAISDGSNSNNEFKVSIENIDPSTGKFDVVVRDYYDSDLSVNVLEKFSSCNMVPGSSNYIALKIGSTDGLYNSKSNYITVEVIENDVTKNSVPAGFLGYPVRNYGGFVVSNTQPTVVAPYFEYNTMVDDEIKNRKQYFGVSDLSGIDEDVFSYKGVEAYDGNPEGLTPCFHLDARILNGKRDEDGNITEGGITQKLAVDGITGYSFTTVNKNNTTSYGIEPRIGDEATMYGTIYEDKSLRKFTVAMYGGWDGWDYYRTSRSNSDEYKYNAYKGAIDSNSGYGTMFSVPKNVESLGYENGDKVITSDYYAYLSGVKQLGNPHSITVNVLATPGIDYVNNTALVDEVIEIVEDDRGDLVYVITTPDKPFGAGDSIEEMYTAEDAVNNLDDTDIDSNHCCTYYPWVKYYDSDNFQYVYLPLTRDVVTSIAYTDNVKFSWYSNAGWNRGNIPDSASPRKKITSPEQNTLYNGRINFVNSFAEEGNKIWGDKNLQIDDNLLNRISKRRLLLRIRTMLKNACIGMLFDPNDVSQSKSVRSAVEKVLDTVKKGRGIFDYKIEIDDSPETRDQLGLNVTYHIKPVQNLEWINFTSVLTPEGMQWE